MRKMSLAVLAATLLWTGCSGTRNNADIVLATVGDRNITAEDFRQYYLSFDPVDRAPLDSLEAKRALLEDLINKDTMELAAYDALPELTVEQGWRLKRLRRSLLTKVLKARYINELVKVTEADIDTAYAHLSRDVFLDGILLPEGDMAREMKRRIDEGASFEDICREYSIWDSGNPDAPWEIGWSSAGQLTNWDMEVAAWNAQPGDIIGPYLEVRGWWILRVGESREKPVEGDRASWYSKLRYVVQKPRYLERERAFQDSILAVAGAEYPEAAKLVLFQKFDWTPPPGYENDNMARYNVQRTIPEVTEDEGKLPAVVFKDGTVWDVSEFLERTSWYASGLWPIGSSMEELTQFMDQVVRDDAYERAAVDLGLESDPDFAVPFQQRQTQMRVNFLYHNIVVGPVEASEEEIKTWFDNHRDRYQAPAGYRLAMFSSGDEEAMKNLRQQWIDGAGFGQLRDEFNTRVDDLVYVGDSSWLSEGEDPAIDNHLADVKVGDVAPLFKRNDQTFVMRLLDRRDRRLVTYEEAKELIDKDATTHAKDQALKDFLAQFKDKVGVTVNEEALAELSFTPEELAPADSTIAAPARAR